MHDYVYWSTVLIYYYFMCVAAAKYAVSETNKCVIIISGICINWSGSIKFDMAIATLLKQMCYGGTKMCCGSTFCSVFSLGKK